MGLVNARDALSSQSASVQSQDRAGDFNFSVQQAQNLEGSLAQADNDNLNLITHRIIQTQQAAQGSAAQLQITLPTCGQLLSFSSPLLVDPMADMTIAFHAAAKASHRTDHSSVYACAIFAGLVMVGVGSTRLVRWTATTPREAQVPLPQDQAPLDNDAQVSSEELL